MSRVSSFVSNRSIAAKIAAGVMVMTILTMVVSGAGLLSVTKLDQTVDRTSRLANILTDVNNAGVSVSRFLNNNDRTAAADAKISLSDSVGQLDALGGGGDPLLIPTYEAIATFRSAVERLEKTSTAIAKADSDMEAALVTLRETADVAETKGLNAEARAVASAKEIAQRNDGIGVLAIKTALVQAGAYRASLAFIQATDGPQSDAFVRARAGVASIRVPIGDIVKSNLVPTVKNDSDALQSLVADTSQAVEALAASPGDVDQRRAQVLANLDAIAKNTFRLMSAFKSAATNSNIDLKRTEEDRNEAVAAAQMGRAFSEATSKLAASLFAYRLAPTPAQEAATAAKLDEAQTLGLQVSLSGLADPASATALFKDSLAVLTRTMKDFSAARGETEASSTKATHAVGDIVQIQASTASAVGRSSFLSMNSAVITALVVALAAAFSLTRLISKPISRLTQVMGRLAAGDNLVDIPTAHQADEIGQMARTVLVFKDAAIAKIKLQSDADATRRLADSERLAHEAAKEHAARQDQFAIDALGQGLSSLASGDLAHRIDTAFVAKTDRLRLDFNTAIDQLRRTMQTISEKVQAIRSGTGAIKTASQDLSKRTEQQASSLEETAAALDEIMATVHKTAEGSKHAREVVGRAKKDAEHSAQVVRQAVGAMSGIETSSAQIGQIIGVIDEIAFQTNLLALNAGVEAARAGDAGRGFAVVASEVRALAQRSTEAAKEIKALISASSARVGQGVDLVGQTGDALDRIVSQVDEINGIVGEIAASAQEQAAGLGEVNASINQMDQVTQQNAAMVEETTAASHALAEETDGLVRLIGQFQLGDDGHANASALRALARSARSQAMGRHYKPARA